jgi:hypothetical protein
MEQKIIIELQQRTERLERRLHFFQTVCALGILGLVVYACAALPNVQAQPETSPSVLRVRGIIIEDEQGRARVVLGAPVPDPSEGRRSSPAVGMVINDTAGYERFGLGLQANGRMTMGFDAPPGTGDERNRERLTMGADAEGSAYVRFLDRRTLVPFRMYTDQENRAWVEFLNFEVEGGAPVSVERRRLGFSGWDTIQVPMRP